MKVCIGFEKFPYVLGVARHGMARMDYYILNDPELSFTDILKRHLKSEPLVDKKASAEYEKARSKAKTNLKKEEIAKDMYAFDDDEGEEENKKEDEVNKTKAEDKKDDTKEETKNDESQTKAEKKNNNARRASVSISPPQITLQQMEQMAKGGYKIKFIFGRMS